MNRQILSAPLCCVFLLASSAAVSDGLTVKQFAQIKRVTSAAISPDGTTIAYVLRVPRPLFSKDDGAAWAEWARQAREDYLATLEPDPCPGALDMGVVMKELEARLPADCIVANDGGNFSGWVHRFHQFTHYPSQLGPTNGAMGYGLPAAIAAKLTCPGRRVICFSGDGGFLMTGNELATAMQEGLALVVLVINNGLHGTIRAHQERAHPGRVIATDLVNPDFAAYAASFGAYGEVVERTADFAPALERALGAGRVAVLDLRIDPEAITTRTTLSALRAAAEAAAAG